MGDEAVDAFWRKKNLCSLDDAPTGIFEAPDW